MSQAIDILVLRESVQNITQILAGRGIEVTQRGTRAYVESTPSGRPIRVNLPFIPDQASPELIAAIQGFLDHEVAHLLFTDFTVVAEGAKLGRRVSEMLNLVEDTRIERKMCERFKGSAYNLDNVGQFFITRYSQTEYDKIMASGENMSALPGILMVPAMRAWAGQSQFAAFMSDKWEHVEPFRAAVGDDMIAELSKLAETSDALDWVKRAIDKIKESAPPPAPTSASPPPPAMKGFSAPSESGDEDENENENENDSPSSAPPDKDGEPATDEGEEEGAPAEDENEGESGPSEEEDEDEDEDEGSLSEDEDEGESIESEEGESEEGESEEDASDEDPDGDEDSDENEGGAGSDDEKDEESEEEAEARRELALSSMLGESTKDFDASIAEALTEAANEGPPPPYLPFTKDFDRVEPFELDGGFHDACLHDIEDQTAHMVGTLQKHLERLIIAKSQSHWQPGQRSGRLNPGSLYRLKTGDTRVFRHRHEGESKDVAVSLVVDCSGSMSGSKVRLAAVSAFAISSVLDRLGVSNEVLGFTTLNVSTSVSAEATEEKSRIGREFSRIEPLYIPVFKSFTERLGLEQRRRIAYAPHKRGMLRNNVDGESLQYAARRLLARPEVGKYMIVLSDGNPAAYGDYGSLNRHLKQVVKELTDLDIKMIGIGIEDASVRAYYPNYAVLSRAEELPSQVMRQLSAILLGK